MVLNDFVLICTRFSISLEQGWGLYLSYRNNTYPEMPVAAWMDVCNKGLFDSKGIHKDVRFAFEDADLDNEDNEKTQVELYGEQVRVTREVKNFQKESPQLDSIIDALYGVLVSYEEDVVLKNWASTSLEVFNGNEKMTKEFITWLHLFPTDNLRKNEGWEKLFFTSYDGVMLRNNSKTAVRNFKTKAGKIDTRVYILGTYLFIRSHIGRDGKCFIPKIENFLKVQDQWFETAVEVINYHGSHLALIFDANYNVKSKSAYAGGILV